MPTLGFLKKKRTKDSSGSRDLDSPSSPVKDSPLSPTFSKQNTDSLASAVSAPQSQQNPSSANPTSTQARTAEPMKAQAYNQTPNSPYAPSPAQQSFPQSAQQPLSSSPPQTQPQNVASISNLIHSDNANAAPNDPMDRSAAPNGGAVAPGQADGAKGPLTPRVTKGKYTLGDFNVQRTLGTGSFGRVHLVQSKHNQRFYAVKVLKKGQVVKMKQVEHTNDERRMLAQVKHPFLITLWGTFQDSKNLYMVMDFVEGGELFSLLRKSQVRYFFFFLSAVPASIPPHPRMNETLLSPPH
jgi:protein kinase A